MRNTLLAFFALIISSARFNVWESRFFSQLCLLFCVLSSALAVNVNAQTRMLVSPEVSSNGNFQLSYFALPAIPGTSTVSYALREQVGNGSWTTITSLPVGSTSYNLTNKAPGTYAYRISSTICPPSAACSVLDRSNSEPYSY